MLSDGLEGVYIPDTVEPHSINRQQLSRFPQCPGQSEGLAKLDRPRAGGALCSTYPGLAGIYDRVRMSAKPNYRGCKIPVPSGLNIPAWRRKADLIKDASLIDMLECGFPAGFTGSSIPRQGVANHGSGTKFPEDVRQYLGKECRLGAMLGPFAAPPFQGWNRLNPIMTRPKRASTERRVILDLSYPLGDSVNAAIPANELDGCPFKMRLPNPWNLARGILDCGRGARLYKVDLSRAYRQLRTCPLDWPLLTVGWDEQVFVDVAVPFGLRHGASACQRTTEAVADVVAAEVGASTHPYIDDTAGVAVPLLADKHYGHLLDCMSKLGLEAAPDKCVPPSTRMCWIGVIFDSVKMTMEIEEGRVQEALDWCERMMTSVQVTKHEFQRFIGKLTYASRCTYGARAFTARLLDFMSTLGESGKAALPQAARDDIRWFQAYLRDFNGVTLIRPQVASEVVTVDACPRGAGGVWWGKHTYGVQLPEYITQLNLSISSLECWNLLVAVRLWSALWTGKTVLIFTDNWATACAIESGRADDPLIRGALREMWYWAATRDIDVVVRHIPGESMGVVDALSRRSFDSNAADRVKQFMQVAVETECRLCDVLLAPPLPL